MKLEVVAESLNSKVKFMSLGNKPADELKPKARNGDPVMSETGKALYSVFALQAWDVTRNDKMRGDVYLSLEEPIDLERFSVYEVYGRVWVNQFSINGCPGMSIEAQTLIPVSVD